ncbi:hypothetical protein MTR67_001458 [Solanum verrucosum]|uniref:CCHC-type domain-containing protein n=1 Tax=Solanum verrucosum TaxID=315347 RepID=A0AAF0PNL4_SOLVR|nr:hypothetical protein MTR67_001458 [Solanum verrucosum]
MYAQVSLPVLVSQDEGSLGDQQWFSSAGHVQGVGSGHVNKFHAQHLEKYVPRTLRDRKKDEFMALEQGGMCVVGYEAKFHGLSRYASQLVTSEEERIHLFVKGLNSELQVLYVHMTSARKSFNEVTYFVKKVEGVRRDGQAKALAKKPKSTGNFHGSYSRGSCRPTLAALPIQSSFPASTCSYSGTPQHNFIQDSQGAAPSAGNMQSFDRTCYSCGEPWHIRKDCPLPHMIDPAQQQTRAVVPIGNSNNDRGCPQGLGCLAYLAHIQDVEVESPSIESIPAVSKFKKVFPIDLPSMPPARDIDLCIDLEQGTHPISIPPYRMALVELRELKAQIPELLDKSFI